MQAVCQDLTPHLAHGPLIVSIAAGISCDSLPRWLGPRPQAIVRCMPNTLALLRQGVSGLVENAQVSEQQMHQVENLMSAVGIPLWLEEEAPHHKGTATSGSGHC